MDFSFEAILFFKSQSINLITAKISLNYFHPKQTHLKCLLIIILRKMINAAKSNAKLIHEVLIR